MITSIKCTLINRWQPCNKLAMRSLLTYRPLYLHGSVCLSGWCRQNEASLLDLPDYFTTVNNTDEVDSFMEEGV